MPLNKKNVFFIFSLLLSSCALHQPHITAAGGLEELSSFFDELFGDEAPKKNQNTDKKKQPTTEMPTPAQLAELAKLINALISPLYSLIKTTHPHHASWGGAVYESIKQHRNSLTALESTLLHILSIQSLLPKKELTAFITVLKKYSKDILDLIAAANTIPSAKSTSIAEENAFLLGKTDSLSSTQTQKNLARRTTVFTKLAEKITPLNTELQKMLQDPEFSKIFPEKAKPSDYKPSPSSSRSSYSPSRSSSKKTSSRDSWDDDYSRSPYSSDYSGYDDYGSYDRESEDTDPTTSTGKPVDSTKEASGGTMAPPPPKKKKDEPSEGFVEHVKFLQEDELVTTLQKCLEGGSLLTNSSYFSTLASIFEQLFASQKDGGLSKLASQFKQLEKEAAQEQVKLTEIKKGETKIELPAGVMPNSTEAKEIAEKEQKDRAAITEAQNDYQQLKQGVTSALIRLQHLPTLHRVKESSTPASTENDGIRLAWMLPEHASGEEDDETPKKHLGMNISRNVIDQEDVLCRHGKKTFAYFLDMFGKKFGMAGYIKAQEERLKQEITQFEDQRRKKADLLSGNLVNTPLSAETFSSIQTNVEQLTTLAYELQCEKPTTATNDAHFYQLTQQKMNEKTKAILTTEQQENLKAGLGTSRYHITNGLTSLDQALQRVSTEIPAADVEKLSQALTKAKTAWSGYITEEKISRPKLPRAAKIPEPSEEMTPLESVDDADEAIDEAPKILVPTKKPKQKPIFQGISQDQLQDMLGAIAQKPLPPKKTSKL